MHIRDFFAHVRKDFKQIVMVALIIGGVAFCIDCNTQYARQFCDRAYEAFDTNNYEYAHYLFSIYEHSHTRVFWYMNEKFNGSNSPYSYQKIKRMQRVCSSKAQQDKPHQDKEKAKLE